MQEGLWLSRTISDVSLQDGIPRSLKQGLSCLLREFDDAGSARLAAIESDSDISATDGHLNIGSSDTRDLLEKQQCPAELFFRSTDGVLTCCYLTHSQSKHESIELGRSCSFNLLSTLRQYFRIFRCSVSPIHKIGHSDSRLQLIHRPRFNRIHFLIVIALESHHICNIRVDAVVLGLEGVLVLGAPAVNNGGLSVVDVDGEVNGVCPVQIEKTLGGCALKAFLAVTQREVLLWINTARNGEGNVLVDSGGVCEGEEDGPGGIEMTVGIEKDAGTDCIITSESAEHQDCEVGLLLADQLRIFGEEVEGLARSIIAHLLLAGELFEGEDCFLGDRLLPERQELGVVAKGLCLKAQPQQHQDQQLHLW